MPITGVKKMREWLVCKKTRVPMVTRATLALISGIITGHILLLSARTERNRIIYLIHVMAAANITTTK